MIKPFKRIGVFSLRASLFVSVMSATAQAQDREPEPGADQALRERINCFPAERLVDFFAKMNDVSEDELDTVQANIQAKFTVLDDGVLPQRLFVQHGDASEMDFTISSDGTVPDLVRLGEIDDARELCADDPTRIGQPKEGDNISFSISPSIRFLNRSGIHDIDELRDGVSDGKAHFKTLFGGGVRNLFIPKPTHLMVTYEETDPPAVPDIQAWRENAPIEGLESEIFDGTMVISLKHLEALKTEQLIIKGGAYDLLPVPSIKKMKSLGIRGN